MLTYVKYMKHIAIPEKAMPFPYSLKLDCANINVSIIEIQTRKFLVRSISSDLFIADEIGAASASIIKNGQNLSERRGLSFVNIAKIIFRPITKE